MSDKTSGWDPMEKAWTVITGLVVLLQTVGLALTSWILYSLIDTRDRVTAIENSRFSLRDGHELEKRTGGEILALWKEINAVKGDVRSLSEQRPNSR